MTFWPFLNLDLDEEDEIVPQSSWPRIVGICLFVRGCGRCLVGMPIGPARWLARSFLGS